MKSIKNPAQRRFYEVGDAVCRHCGEPNCILAHYTQTEEGEAQVINSDGDLENHESLAAVNFIVEYYLCTICRTRSPTVEGTLLTEEEMEAGYEEQPL